MRRWMIGSAAAAIALALALAVLGAFESGRPSANAPAALMLAAPAGPAITIGRHPVGLSIEYPLLVHDLGSAGCPPPALVATIAALRSPVLRIGGDSQDEVAPAGAAPHPGVSDLEPGFWAKLGCLERETRIPVVVGLNVASGVAAWAAELAAAARTAIPRSRLSFELGNEPDVYGDPVKWWNGQTLLESAMPWATYLARARALEAALGPGSRIEGPDFASGRWIATVPVLARTLQLRTIDAHYYPLEGCRGHDIATAAALLSRQIQSKLDERVRLARDAHAAGLAAVISETNSVSCGGTSGVSDQPPAAVWALRMILQALRDGFASVRFHSSGGPYDPFVVTGGRVVVRPLYLALRAATQLLAPGGELRAIPNAASLDGVAISDPAGARTIVLSNYGATARWVALEAAAPVRIVRVLPHAPTVQSAVVAPVRRRAYVELAPNSVDAIELARAA